MNVVDWMGPIEVEMITTVQSLLLSHSTIVSTTIGLEDNISSGGGI